MDEIEVQRAVFARTEEPKAILLILWHDKGRSILSLDDEGRFVPVDPASGGALADLLEDLT